MPHDLSPRSSAGRRDGPEIVQHVAVERQPLARLQRERGHAAHVRVVLEQLLEERRLLADRWRAEQRCDRHDGAAGDAHQHECRAPLQAHEVRLDALSLLGESAVGEQRIFRIEAVQPGK